MKSWSGWCACVVSVAGCAASPEWVTQPVELNGAELELSCTAQADSLAQRGITIAATFEATPQMTGDPRFVTNDSSAEALPRKKEWSAMVPPDKVGLIVAGDLLDARLVGEGVVVVVKYERICGGTPRYGNASLLLVPKENARWARVASCPSTEPECSGPPRP